MLVSLKYWALIKSIDSTESRTDPSVMWLDPPEHLMTADWSDRQNDR